MRKIILGLSILSLILTAGIVAVEASDDNPLKGWKAKWENFKSLTPEERQAEMEERKAEMEECKTKTEELKSSEEWQNTSEEERREMLKELDCFPFGRQIRPFEGDIPENHQAVIDAIEAEDYEAWLAATEGRKNVEEITEESFQKLVEAHKLMKEGDKEGAKEIMKELGINRSPQAIKAFGKGFKRGHFKGMSECNCECGE